MVNKFQDQHVLIKDLTSACMVFFCKISNRQDNYLKKQYTYPTRQLA